jgi:hypothetical protein
MDNNSLFPIPNSNSLKREIAKGFKLHCSLVDYKEGGCDIKDIIDENNDDAIKAGKAVVRTLKENLITTNHIERGNDLAIDFETDPVDYINRNEHIQAIKDVDPNLYNMIYNALNKGIFFRNASTRRSFNYWQPLSNAGIPAVPRGDDVHETTFLVHDLLHNLIPDLQLSKNDDLNKIVYIIHRVLGEGICLILADMYFVDALSKRVDYDFKAKNIYQAFPHIKDRELYTNLKANAIYAVTGEKSLFSSSFEGIEQPIHEDVEKYLEWFRPVYISDLKWTLNNISNISSKYDTYSKWLSWFNSYLVNEVSDLNTTGAIVSMAGISQNDSIMQMTEKIFNFMYHKILKPNFNKVDMLTPDERKIKAKRIFYVFQGRIFFDFEAEDTQEFVDYFVAFRDGKYDEAETIYQAFVNSLHEYKKISDDDKRVFNEVYPHFDSYFISYNADVVAPDTLKSYSKELFDSLR